MNDPNPKPSTKICLSFVLITPLESPTPPKIEITDKTDSKTKTRERADVNIDLWDSQTMRRLGLRPRFAMLF